MLVLAIVVPVCGALAAFAAGGRWTERIAFVCLAIGLAIAIGIAVAVTRSSGPLLYRLGGWAPPLGVALRADGLSAAMMAVTAVVIGAVGLYARAEFAPGSVEARAPLAFWILLLSVWAALNTVFLGGDLFTLYVALELLTFAAVPLVSLDGRADTLQAALRYLLFALLGSVLYLVGTALLYGTCGTLDIVLLSTCVRPETATIVAVALMTAGLFAKTALFPLHLWLPPAHAGAPSAASAVLSALVVKGSFFITVRLWFDAVPALPGYLAAQLPALLGGAAILFGSIVALRQRRLKLLIAYSTLAQIGYLFLMFPLAFDPADGALHRGAALAGGMIQAASHAMAKAAMFLVAGLAYEALGHDRISGFAGMGRALPLSVLAFALAGAALIGVPPSGAYLAKTSPPAGIGRNRAMVVGRRHPGRRGADQQLRPAGARPLRCTRRRPRHASRRGATKPRGAGVGARARLVAARTVSMAAIPGCHDRGRFRHNQREHADAGGLRRRAVADLLGRRADAADRASRVSFGRPAGPRRARARPTHGLSVHRCRHGCRRRPAAMDLGRRRTAAGGHRARGCDGGRTLTAANTGLRSNPCSP